MATGFGLRTNKLARHTSLDRLQHRGLVRRLQHGTHSSTEHHSAEVRTNHVRSLGEVEQQAVDLLPLVKRIAFEMHQHLPAHVDMDDLIGAGSLGLVDALQKFDASKGVKIESYARHRIRGAILDSLRSLDNASRDQRKKSKKMEQAYRDVEAELEGEVSDSEMAEKLGVTLEEWYRTVRELQTLGLDWLRPRALDGLKQRVEEAVSEEEASDPFLQCYRHEQREILARALAGLSERGRELILLYYYKGATMKEIAAKLGVDESRVSQLHSSLLERLRKRVNTLLRSPATRFDPRPSLSVSGQRS